MSTLIAIAVLLILFSVYWKRTGRKCSDCGSSFTIIQRPPRYLSISDDCIRIGKHIFLATMVHHEPWYFLLFFL